MSGLVRWPIPGARLAQGQGAQIITPPTVAVDATVTAVTATAAGTAPAATVAGAAGPSREFDGVDDVLTVDNGIIFPLSNGAHSFVMVVKPTSLNSGECFMAARAGGANIAALYDNGSGGLAWLDADETLTASAGLTAGAWQIIGFSKATGTSVARFHRKELGAGSWTHVNSAGSGTGVSTAVTSITFGAAGAAAFKDCRIAAAAVFSAELSDGDFESIVDATQDISALSPLALWDFNQASTATDVLDLTNNGASQTALTGTTATTDGPSGWTFGVGTGDATVTAVPAVALGSAPVASATVTAGATVTAVPAAATGDTPAAVVTGTGSATVTAVPATALGSAPPANSILSSVVNAPAVIALGSAPVAVISSAGNATVTAVPATALGSAPVAVLSSGQTWVAVVADATGAVPAAVISAGATVAAVIAVASGQAPRPTISPAPTGGVSGDIAATFAEAFS